MYSVPFCEWKRPPVARPVAASFLMASAVLPVPIGFGPFDPLYRSLTIFPNLGSLTFGIAAAAPFAATANPTAPCRTFGLKSQCDQGLAAGRARHRRQCKCADPLRRFCSCTHAREEASSLPFLAAGREAAKKGGTGTAVFGSRPRASRPKGLALTRSEFSALSYAVQAETSACTAWRPRFAAVAQHRPCRCRRRSRQHCSTWARSPPRPARHAPDRPPRS